MKSRIKLNLKIMSPMLDAKYTGRLGLGVQLTISEGNNLWRAA